MQWSTVVDTRLVISACVWLCVCVEDLLPVVSTNGMQDIKETVFCQMLILFYMPHFKYEEKIKEEHIKSDKTVY